LTSTGEIDGIQRLDSRVDELAANSDRRGDNIAVDVLRPRPWRRL
jgi:hypothetical protein